MKLLLGPPSSGKTEIAKFLVKQFKMIQIDLGQIIRSKKNKDLQILSMIKKGESIPHSIIKLLFEDEILIKKTNNIELKDVLLVGYPVSVDMIDSLYYHTVESVIWLECPEEECIRRMVSLYVCPSFESHLWANMRYYSWWKDAELVRRYYKIRGNLSVFNTNQPLENVKNEISRKIFGKKLEEINNQEINWKFIYEECGARRWFGYKFFMFLLSFVGALFQLFCKFFTRLFLSNV
ncbi:adenylate kinase [Cucumispora dikerogammari]|nr:adenylate kinase [Cucumispora dikerogammari]